MSRIVKHRADGVRVTMESRTWQRGGLALALCSLLAIGFIWSQLLKTRGSDDGPPPHEEVRSYVRGDAANRGQFQRAVTGPSEVAPVPRVEHQGQRARVSISVAPRGARRVEEDALLASDRVQEGTEKMDLAAPEEGPSGIALFPPPGTNPPKRGLIVPEDFQLPPGYVRHYQVTDDGKPLPPILMFHPDVELYDAEGNRIPLPADLVVPPELAPQGFPREFLEVPEEGVPLLEPAPSEDVGAVGGE